MKEISITKFKQMSVNEIKETGCFKLIADGEEVAIVIVGAEEVMKDRVIIAGEEINAGRGIK